MVTIDIQDFPEEIKDFLTELVTPLWDFPPEWMEIIGSTHSDPEDQEWEDFEVTMTFSHKETTLLFDNYEGGWVLRVSDSSETKLSDFNSDHQAFWLMLFNIKKSEDSK